LECYKAHWARCGFTQQPDIDYNETFSPTVKSANIFLHGMLSEIVHCSQLMGFIHPAHLELVCHLNKFICGLKKAPRACYSRFTAYMLSLSFAKAKSNALLLIFCHGSKTVYVLLYVDDIVLITFSNNLLQRIISAPPREIAMQDLTLFTLI
jgi:hypothetical protein